jgi:hypothetical protein
LARLDALIAKLEPLRAEMAPSLPIGGEHLFRHIEKQRLLDRDWLQGLLADVETGLADEAAPVP